MPGKLWIRWVWQEFGSSGAQWCRTMSQERAEAGSVPSSGSVAEPEKETVSPTFHVVPATGVAIVATGGAFVTYVA